MKGGDFYMNEILIMFLFTVFMLLSVVVVGFSFKNQVIIIIVIITMSIVLIVFYIYIKYISKLATNQIKKQGDCANFKLFINYILTSETDLKLYIDKHTATQIIKILNDEIYSVKDIYIYKILQGDFTAKKIRDEILEELEYLNKPQVYESLVKAYDKLSNNNYYNYNILIVSLDTWIIQQLMYMRTNKTAKVENFQYEQLINIIESIDEMIIQY